MVEEQTTSKPMTELLGLNRDKIQEGGANRSKVGGRALIGPRLGLDDWGAWGEERSPTKLAVTALFKPQSATKRALTQVIRHLEIGFCPKGRKISCNYPRAETEEKESLESDL